MYYDFYYKPYVSVAERQRKAQRAIARLQKQGHKLEPVSMSGRKPAVTFWGKAWCDNLESYSDFSNRLPRGTSYLRNGQVLDLQIGEGKVEALVQGTDLYRVKVAIAPLSETRWKPIVDECSGKIDSVIELLRGKLSKGVMEVLVARDRGLFPSPREIRLECSCPDYADMCKHLAAALYGVGARLDERPELLFTLRQVDLDELVARAGQAQSMAAAPSGAPILDTKDLSSLFGIELEHSEEAAPETSSPALASPGAAPGPAARKEPVSAATSRPPGRDAPTRRTAAKARPAVAKRHAVPRGKTKPAAAPEPKAGTAPAAARSKPSPARAAAKASPSRRKRVSTVTVAELQALGFGRGTLRTWLGEGFLIPTGERDRYETTPAAEVRMMRRRRSLQD